MGAAQLVRAARVDQLAAEEFRPEKYTDAYRDRVQAVVEKKIAGEEITIAESDGAQPQVIDLMEALKKSLTRRRQHRGGKGPAQKAGTRGAVATAARQTATPRRRARKA